MADRMALIEAPEGTQEFGHTVSYSPILGGEGKMIERYELVLHVDGTPCGCAYATDPAEFKDLIHRWETFGKVLLPEM